MKKKKHPLGGVLTKLTFKQTKTRAQPVLLQKSQRLDYLFPGKYY